MVAVTISPARNRTFTISAGERFVFSPIVCGVAPWITCSTGPVGTAGSSTGRRRGLATFGSSTFAGSCGNGAANVATAAAPAGSAFGSVLAFGLALGLALRGAGGGSRTSRGLAGVVVAFPPDARRRGTTSSGTLEEADLPVTPIAPSVPSNSLLVTPSSFASSWTLTPAPAPARRTVP